MNISRGAYNILFLVSVVKTFLKIFCREDCVNIVWLKNKINEFTIGPYKFFVA
jgi:hypothetical protein